MGHLNWFGLFVFCVIVSACCAVWMAWEFHTANSIVEREKYGEAFGCYFVAIIIFVGLCILFWPHK